jgi:hypothetical protein
MYNTQGQIVSKELGVESKFSKEYLSSLPCLRQREQEKKNLGNCYSKQIDIEQNPLNTDLVACKLVGDSYYGNFGCYNSCEKRRIG